MQNDQNDNSKILCPMQFIRSAKEQLHKVLSCCPTIYQVLLHISCYSSLGGEDNTMLSSSNSCMIKSDGCSMFMSTSWVPFANSSQCTIHESPPIKIRIAAALHVCKMIWFFSPAFSLFSQKFTFLPGGSFFHQRGFFIRQTRREFKIEGLGFKPNLQRKSRVLGWRPKSLVGWVIRNPSWRKRKKYTFVAKK